jgi:hypothetical protein
MSSSGLANMFSNITHAFWHNNLQHRGVLKTATLKAIIKSLNFFLTYHILGPKVKLVTIYSMSKGSLITSWRE